MFGSTILEIAIGLIFVYLLLGLICTTLNELFAMIGNSRAANLRQGIHILLGGAAGQELVQKFYAHPLIKSLSKEHKQPSYIPARMFVLTLLDKFVPAHSTTHQLTLDELRAALNNTTTDWPLNPELKQILNLLIKDAEAKVQIHGGEALAHLQTNLEEWFNQTMERVAGWYKRKTQLWSWATAAVLVLALNVDTISIAHSFATNAALRAAVVNTAENYVAPPPAAPTVPAEARPEDIKKKFDQVKAEITSLRQFGFPLGWEQEVDWKNNLTQFLSKILGLILTICAASLGAPFWFDMLKKVIAIRTSGRSPEDVQRLAAELQAKLNR